MDFDGIDAAWIWVTLGLVLAALEILVPGVYLVWFAVAAVLTGAITFASDIGLAAQVVTFAGLSLIAAYSAKRILRDRPIVSADPLLNHRGNRLVGETAVTATTFEGGSGRVRVADGEWIARGPDVAAGERVRIIGHDGTILLVEPLTLLQDEGTQPPAPM